MNEFLNLELELLQYWKSKGVKYLYKYKHCVKEYRGGKLTNVELFLDLTSGLIFTDVVDIADFKDVTVTGEKVKVNIDKLIENRK